MLARRVSDVSKHMIWVLEALLRVRLSRPMSQTTLPASINLVALPRLRSDMDYNNDLLCCLGIVERPARHPCRSSFAHLRSPVKFMIPVHIRKAVGDLQRLLPPVDDDLTPIMYIDINKTWSVVLHSAHYCATRTRETTSTQEMRYVSTSGATAPPSTKACALGTHHTRRQGFIK